MSNESNSEEKTDVAITKMSENISTELKQPNTDPITIIGDLQRQKLESEITLLQIQIKEVLKPAPKKTFWDYLEKNLTKIMTIVGFVTAAIGLLGPGYDYLANTDKHSRAQFSSESIKLINTISDTAETIMTRKKNLAMLVFYDPEVVLPFLFKDICDQPNLKQREILKEMDVDDMSAAIMNSWNHIEEKGWLFNSIRTGMGITPQKERIAQLTFTSLEQDLTNINFNDVDQIFMLVTVLNLLAETKIPSYSPEFRVYMVNLGLKILSAKSDHLNANTKIAFFEKIIKAIKKC